MSEVSMYEKMKARGINMGWYERSKHRKNDTVAVPLDDDVCSLNSVYLLKANGQLWTVGHSGKEHAKVREGTTKIPKDVYLCMCCRTQWGEMPKEHPINQVEE